MKSVEGSRIQWEGARVCGQLVGNGLDCFNMWGRCE